MFAPLKVNWVSGQPHLNKKVVVLDDGTVVSRTAEVIDGKETNVRYTATPGLPYTLVKRP